MPINCYRDLEVWQKGMDLVVLCYRVTGLFPRTEMYGLSSQLQRSVVSIPANIAEEHGRTHTKEYLYHLSVAYGSLMESETQLQNANRLGYVDALKIQPPLDLAATIGKMLNRLIASLNAILK